MNLKELKESLTKLESNHIYDYNKETKKIYKFFASFYEKVEAIDYLLKTNQSNESQNISAFYDRRDQTNKTITIKNIQDTEEFIKKYLNIKFITTKLGDDDIKIFETYSKKILQLLNQIEMMFFS